MENIGRITPYSPPRDSIPTDSTANITRQPGIHPSAALHHINDAINTLESITDAAPQVESSQALQPALEQPGSYPRPIHEILSALSTTNHFIDQASAAIGDPQAAPPIFRFRQPAPSVTSIGNAPTAKPRRCINLSNLNAVDMSSPRPAASIPSALNAAAKARPAQDEPQGPLTQHTLPAPTGLPRPALPTRPISWMTHLNVALQHLNQSAASLGAQSDVPPTDFPPSVLKQCNANLKQAKSYIEAAQTSVKQSDPTQPTLPKAPPIIGGDEDLTPSIRKPNIHQFFG